MWLSKDKVFALKYQAPDENFTSGISWDELLDPKQSELASKWFQDLKDLLKIKIPRCIQQQNQCIVILSLHAFTEASGIAYGAVTYAKCQYRNGEVSIDLIAAKSPLSALSIPRLELCGAVLGLRLSHSIAATYKIDFKEVTFWTDSNAISHKMNVIHFVANKMANDAFFG
ncbi:uncharacterized protein LOC105848115 [Hydra vulgaris]|uniref:uncharacterized protein LOC105848115 n=1 Tax=Hydra vulgaris TaxID=6087 RepID=UPI001F5FEC8C|nr:uncharacterized protein LOC105848115 [Hydra vulgaris]